LFAFQIFCDFSGYSDIAIGAARVMGIKLMLNFDRPYFSKSISEFWKRWHISLSSWFKDYLYISLGGNRVPVPRWYFNLFIVFLVSGLWHGANWTFVIWGALHGIYLITSILTAKLRGKIVKQVGLNESPLLHKYLKVLVTFSLVCFSWIFFRANNLSDAFYMVTHLFSGWNVLFESPALWSAITLGMPKTFIISVVFISMMEMIHLLQRHGSVRQMISELPVWQRWPLYYITVLIILAFGVYDNTPFIYFQF
ncbi:MAG: MBOAT family O-acyltransferase, partial [Gemmatimonadota bacterium]|nr:MBOAT family O-acyltransferase [Gemmatimonadota bacterium]